MRYLDRTDPIAGKNIELHMDARLQQAAEEALGEFRGAVVAIEPATGGILAMVSKPGFDPTFLSRESVAKIIVFWSRMK